MDLNPICQPSPANKMKCYFVDYVQLLMLARLVNGLKPHPPPLSSQTNEMLLFGLCSLLMISQAGRWTQTPSITLLQPIKWNTHFWITFNFWWSAGLVSRLKPHSLPLSSQKNEMFIFWSCSTSDDRLGWSMDSNPILDLSPAKEMKCSFFGFCSNSDDWLGWLMDSNPIHHPSAPKKNEMLIFGLRSTSDDWPGWSMDWNSLCHPSPANNMKCYFLDYVQLLMIGWAGQWTQTPSTTPLQPKQWNAHFCITFNMWCWPDWSMDLNLIHHPSAPKKMKWSFWIMFNFWWLAGLVNGLKLPLPPLSSQKHEMLLFGLHSTSDDWLGWSMDSNPILHPSPAKTVKCSFLYYIQHVMLARLVNGLEPHPPPLCTQKNEMVILDYVQLLMISQAALWTQTHLPPLSCQKMKCLFLDYVQLLMISWAARWTWTRSTPHLQPENWNAHILIMFNFWW